MDRILVEIPSDDDAYIRNKYAKAINNSIFDVTGKWYMVTIAKQGEFVVENDIDSPKIPVCNAIGNIP